MEVAILICVMVWLALGGWSFSKLVSGMDKDAHVGMFLLCIALAPFMAAAATTIKSDDED